MKLLVLTLVIVLLVGFHVLPAWTGTLAVLALLIVSGIGVRLLKLFAGGLLFLIGLGA
jgi:hypothetical protein